MDYCELLEKTKKEDLIELLLIYAENGTIPLEPFVLKADVDFTPEQLEEIWEHACSEAYEYEDLQDESRSDLAASMLRDVGEFTLDKVMKYEDHEACRRVCRMMVKKLRAANDIDGIGMCGDAEWIYGEVLHQIEKYLADEFGEAVEY